MSFVLNVPVLSVSVYFLLAAQYPTLIHSRKQRICYSAHTLLYEWYQKVQQLESCKTFLYCQWHFENIPCDTYLNFCQRMKRTTVPLCVRTMHSVCAPGFEARAWDDFNIFDEL